MDEDHKNTQTDINMIIETEYINISKTGFTIS